MSLKYIVEPMQKEEYSPFIALLCGVGSSSAMTIFISGHHKSDRGPAVCEASRLSYETRPYFHVRSNAPLHPIES